ncbi:MAG: glutamine--fructose-6-phosphate transaminase (isomerizing) [Christensenellales bacterium]|jgi:glucosamine--fructose-6-phosphate aminotransferase (isomerizing)
MCGIVGYVGTENAVPFLMTGLRHLEYRGYDSAGLAVMNGSIQVRKAKGRLDELDKVLEADSICGTLGIGHTRWATHGEPNYVNSHPHLDQAEKIAVVHNGIIENYYELKQQLIAAGVNFQSETDTEVVVQLMGYLYKGNILETIFEAVHRLEGAFALAIICRDNPDTMYCIRKDSPLIVGKGKDASFIASDIPAMLEHTRNIYFMENGDIAELTREKINFYDSFGNAIVREPHYIEWDVESAEKGGYAHFMIKEINEQPQALRNTLNRYVDVPGKKVRENAIPISTEEARNITRMGIIACGTAYHAGLVGKTLFERIWRVPVEVHIASEFRYQNPIVRSQDVYIIVSQSGETADTIAAMRLVKEAGCKVIAICNVLGSTIAREADHVLYTQAGPEIAVASTKAYTTQMMLLYILAIDIAQKRGDMDAARFEHLVDEMAAVPDKVAQLLESQTEIQRFASQVFDCHSSFFIGRGLDYSLAMEAALKLKEISYIHCEAMAAGELKHGTIALIEDGVLVVAIATQQQLMDKMVSNIKEVAVRGANVLTVSNGENELLRAESNHIWVMPRADDMVMPMILIVPLQLFAYYMALARGCDIDKPRNLAKSVTVE